MAVVRGDDGVEFSQVARAVDIVRGSGIDHVGAITAKTQTGQLLESLQPSELVIFRRSYSS
jgi:hypothetical protein